MDSPQLETRLRQVNTPFPPCPRCHEPAAGKPTDVTMTVDHRIVRYQCSACQHEWAIARTAADRLLGHFCLSAG